MPNEDLQQDADPEGPDQSDMDPDNGPLLVKCPYCGRMISEDTEICHLCGSYITEEASRRVPMWILVGVVLAMVGMVWWIVVFIVKGLMR